MNRRDFLKAAGFGATSLAVTGCMSERYQSDRNGGGGRPNILWLISEDTSPDLGCYGNKLVKTPNLDKLASEGVRFTNAFVTGPVCSAARSAFMTGMYQTTIDAHHHRSHRTDDYTLPEPVRVFTEYFRDAGYFACNCAGLNYKKWGKADWNFKPLRWPFEGANWGERQPEQPFYAQVNFALTHRNFQRDSENPINPEKVRIPPYYPDYPVIRRDWADYLESIQVLDRQAGLVLKRLEDEGLSDSTIVVYFADHGRPHLRDKQWLYEGGIRIPLIIRWPGHIEAGTVIDDLVSAIDFGPTCLHLAGIKPPDHMQGRIFLGNKEKRRYIFAARDRCDETVDRIRCVRTKRYKYIRNFFPERPYTQFNAYKKNSYPALTLMEVLHKRGELTPKQARFMALSRPKEELYDLENDPYELNDLAGDPEFEQIHRELSTELDKWIKRTGDKGQISESKEVVAYWENEMSELYKKWMEEKGLCADISPEKYLEWWENKLLK